MGEKITTKRFERNYRHFSTSSLKMNIPRSSLMATEYFNLIIGNGIGIGVRPCSILVGAWLDSLS